MILNFDRNMTVRCYQHIETKKTSVFGFFVKISQGAPCYIIHINRVNVHVILI